MESMRQNTKAIPALFNVNVKAQILKVEANKD